jgi:hypothetical protein
MKAHKRQRSRLLVLGLVAALVCSLATPGSSKTAPLLLDTEQECQEIPPQEIPPPALDVEETLPLEVRVLVESQHLTLAKEHLARTKEIYGTIGIRLKIRYQAVTPPSEWGDGEDLTGGPDQPKILAFMKDELHGRRPNGVDVVYFITKHWDGGFADCIGGIRYADRAFAFGSIDYAFEGVVPAPTVNEGVIAAHEIAHLLGAHHHYSNCTEALPFGAPNGDLNPCTVMSPSASTASGTFGILERSFIRSYVAEYAKG